MNNSNASYQRYSRQLALKEFGETGQQKLLQAKVLMVGAGGLGCAALPYLAAAGIGKIGIIDHDLVALHNLHRQVLYTMQDIGLSKARCAAIALQRLNPEILVEAFDEKLTVANALPLLARYDIIIDGTDNFATRYLVNDACVLLHKPLVYAAVSKIEGQLAVFNYTGADDTPSANYRDLFPEPPLAGTIPNCAEAGVLGVLPGIIGCMQAGEAIKLVTGMGRPLVNSLLSYNMLNNEVYQWQLAAKAATRLLIPADAAAFEQADYETYCGTGPEELEIDLQEFNTLSVQKNTLVIDVREYHEPPLIEGLDHIHIPLGRLADQIPDTERDTIVVVCQSGIRSLQAAKILSATFDRAKKVFSLKGGILQWIYQQP